MQAPHSPQEHNLNSQGTFRNVVCRPSEMIFAEGAVGFLEAGHGHYSEAGYSFQETNDDLLLIWCTSGTIEVDTVEHVFELTQGDACVALPGTTSNVCLKTPVSFWRAMVSGPGLAEAIATSNLRTGTIFGHPPPEHLLKLVMQDMADNDLDDKAQVSQDRLARQFIAQIENHTQNYPDPPELMRAVSFIDNGLGDWDFTIATLVDSLGWHHGSLVSMFKANFNMTPSRYLLNRRMLRAANQLEETTRSVSQIGENCGFVNLTSFSRSFRRFHGVSPRAFREQKNSQPG